MTATAQTIITEALRKAKILDAGETPTADDSTDALTALNGIIAGHSVENFFVPYNTLETVSLTGAASYTIGSGGDFNTTRPIRIVQAFTRISNIDYPCQIVNREEFFAIPYKVSTGTYPDFIYYDDSFALGIIYTYPLCTATLYLDSQKAVTEFATLSTASTIPREYERLLTLELALDRAGEYGTQPSPVIDREISRITRAIKRNNAKPPILRPNTEAKIYNNILAG